ncbi:MAG: bifunctional histidinol-phosphatase/imidazoleglycerol-phosphate dehydratase HisB [Bacteroidales bacterium]|nr:bifunctional histidinol-phosphatase/imidazoleglycerol-phosphate dehydratase HisB [Bacteroidales bacterium]
MTTYKALFIDRDGTILREPEDEQVDSLAKFHFVPGVIGALKVLRSLPYRLVLASNQDGLGTPAFPEEAFLPPHQLMLETLQGEGIRFDDELIDTTFPEDRAPTRKPGTGLFTAYLDGSCDLAESFVIGDRLSDVQLAANLGAKAILLMDPEKGIPLVREAGLPCELITLRWDEAAEFLRRGIRRSVRVRETRETRIRVAVDLDGRMDSSIRTGLRFFDHMLQQIPHHSGIALQVEAEGDLDIDEHHTMEDTAITLGEALLEALGDRRGIRRYGFALPMDDCDAQVLLDLGGRIDFAWDVPFTREYVGDTPTEMFRHVFQSLGAALKANLHISARGGNNHHLAEAVFKAFARALGEAVRREGDRIPSSKGSL